MDCRKLTDRREVRALYRRRVSQDFPSSERQPIRTFTKMAQASNCDLNLYLLDGQAVGYAMLYEKNGYVLLNYFAVYPELRGQGIGRALLQEIAQAYADKQAIYMEVEHTAYALDEADATVRQKRIHFYQACGYHLLEELDVVLFGEHYYLMILPLHNQVVDDAVVYQTLWDTYRDLMRLPEIVQKRLLYVYKKS